MDAGFWHQKWKDNEIGFDQSEANPLLVKYFNTLSLVTGSRVFVPLCGKTIDIAWLLSNDYRVVGIELSELAVEQLFAALELEPRTVDVGNLKRYSAQNIDIFVGDVFDLTREMLLPVDAVYDRAALVALPENMRGRYTAHLIDITDTAPQLLLTFVYDQSLMDGPPFSISDKEVKQHYETQYDLTRLANMDVPGGFKEKYPAMENVWLLEKR